jgi:triphosphoribosyl-dephospho-CoA synthetase
MIDQARQVTVLDAAAEQLAGNITDRERYEAAVKRYERANRELQEAQVALEAAQHEAEDADKNLSMHEVSPGVPLYAVAAR